MAEKDFQPSIVSEFASPECARPASRRESTSAAILTMMVGLVVAWKWEGIGGVLILGGFAFLSIVNHRISINIVFGPWLLTGLIYLAC